MKTAIAALLLAVCMFTALAAPEFEPSFGTVNTEGAALRAEPSKAAVYSARLSLGADVCVLELITNDEGSWFLTEYNGVRGYVAAGYIDVLLTDADGNRVYIPETFRVSVSAVNDGYNHVGGSWTREFYINSEEFDSYACIALSPGDKVNAEASFTENDKSPDTGRRILAHTVTESELKAGFTLSFDVYVTENKGRYAGSSCVWHVTFRFEKQT